MLLVNAGKLDYPLGIYTNAERNALEAADDRADHTGATFNDTDVAVKRRYGITVRKIADGTLAGLRAELTKPGQALAIAGSNARLSTFLRRWDPAFSGAHAVCVVVKATGLTWLDPLAPDRYPGDPVTVDEVLRWAFMPSDARVGRTGILAPPAETPEQRIDRLRLEILAIAKRHPTARRRWAINTGMVQGIEGTQVTEIMRLSAEVTYLREVDRNG